MGLDVEHLTRSDKGVKLLLARSKTDKEGEGAEVMIVSSRYDGTCPVAALQGWLGAGKVTAAPCSAK